MQNSDSFDHDSKKPGKIPRFGARISERLKQKNEREVRARLAAFVGFAVWVLAAYLLSTARLFFGTYPFPAVLMFADRKRLPPLSVGVIAALVFGGLPILYGYMCLAVLMIRVLSVLFPAIFEGLTPRERACKDMIVYTEVGIEESDAKSSAAMESKAFSKGQEDENENMEGIIGCFREMFCEKLYIRLLCGAIAGVIFGMIVLIERDFSFYGLCALLSLTVAVPLGILSFVGALSDASSSARWYQTLSLILIFAFCTLGAAGKSFIGMPMPPFLAILFTLVLTTEKGMLLGAVSGAVFGLALDPTYIPMLLISAVLFGIVSAVKKSAGVAAVCGLVVVWCYYIGGESGLVGILPPMLLALPIYMIIDKYKEMMSAPYKREAAGGLYFAEAVTEKTKNRDAKERLDALSEVFSSLSATFYKLSDRFRRPDVLGLKRIGDEAFDKVCEGCRNRELCRGAEYSRTLRTMSCVSSALHERGVLTDADFPDDFKDICIRKDKLVETVNASVKDTTEKIINDGKLNFFTVNYDEITSILKDALKSDGDEYECDIAVAEQIFGRLGEMGLSVGGTVVYGKRCKHVVVKGILSDDIGEDMAKKISLEISKIVGGEMSDPIFEVGRDGTVMLLYSRPAISARCSHGRLSRSGAEWNSGKPDENEKIFVDPFAEEEICGDMTDAFVTDNSYFYSLISDGMGSGEEAAYTSEVCAMFIQKMLSAGNRADVTLRMLNNVIRSENMGCGSECSATVDLLELDLMSGAASFIKSGAAPTYIARNDTVYKVSSRTMPVGIIKNADARITRFDTKKGDIIVMISDGCCHDSEDCPWLVEYLCAYMSKRKKTVDVGGELCERLKDEIIREAVKNIPEGEERDDISVSVTIVG